MGMSYTPHKMVGAYIQGQMEDLYLFLAKNKNKITKKQKEDIEEGGQFNEDIVELLKFEDVDIVMLNSWSGHDFVIGYHVNDTSQTEEYAEKFNKYFPKVKAEYHDFTEVS
jgi:hypothetical protein